MRDECVVMSDVMRDVPGGLHDLQEVARQLAIIRVNSLSLDRVERRLFFQMAANRISRLLASLQPLPHEVRGLT
jgi:hypothetical protein